MLLAQLVLLGAALVCSLLLAIRALSGSEPVSARVPAIMWLLICLIALAFWPKSSLQGASPARMLPYLLAVFALPLMIAQLSDLQDRWAERQRIYRMTLVVLTVGVAMLATVLHLFAFRPTVEGVDFYMNVCFARDLNAGHHDVAMLRYVYFPGVYRFWRLAMSVAGASLAAIQWSYLVLLVGNAVLVAAIVFRTSRSMLLSLWSGLWLMVLLSHLEGFGGLTEPITTLPFLVGMLIWGGEPLRGRRGLINAALLGAALGLTVFMRQQAGILPLGAVGLLVNLVLAPRQRRHQLGALALLPVLAVSVLVACFALEGEGLEPVRIGLRMVSGYTGEASWIANLQNLCSFDRSLPGAALFAVLAWIALTWRRRQLHGEPIMGLASWCLPVLALTLLQYRWRGYAHFSLIGAPCLVFTVALLAWAVWRMLPDALRRHNLTHLFLLGLAAAPLLVSSGGAQALHLWSFNPWERAERIVPWHEQPDIVEDVAALRELVEDHDNLVILPPRRNVIHFLLGTRSLTSSGYRFGFRNEGIDLPGIDWQTVDAVLVLQQGLDSTDVKIWSELECAAALEGAQAAGLRHWQGLHTMTLWMRVPADS